MIALGTALLAIVVLLVIAYRSLLGAFEGLAMEKNELERKLRVAQGEVKALEGLCRAQEAVLASYRPSPWNPKAKGPQDECLLKVRWLDGSGEDWIQFDFHPADYSWEGEEDGYVGHGDEYHNKGLDLTVRFDEDTPYSNGKGWESDSFEILEWMPVPGRQQ